MDMARCGESLSRAATHGAVKGVNCLGSSFARVNRFSVVAAGEGVEIFSFETGDIGIVHLDELEVSEGVACGGESVMVSRFESNVSIFVQSCEHLKKNV